MMKFAENGAAVFGGNDFPVRGAETPDFPVSKEEDK